MTEDFAGDLRQLVATGCRVLSRNGHSDYVWGHLSVRDPEGRGVWMKGSGLGFEEIEPENVLLVDFDGNILEGSGPRHVEWPIHTEVIAAREDISAVVHSHPPHSIALAAAEQPLRPVSHAGTMFVPPDVPRFTETGNLITTRALGKAVAAALDAANALLLVNHGIVTAGRTVQDAVIAAILLENAAHQQMLTEVFGGTRRWSPDEEALEKRALVWSETQRRHMWDYLVRRLEATDTQTA
jgi:ribulose-5-phosphate 4-epimerase/fuculose-1-phosphate aldolase